MTIVTRARYGWYRARVVVQGGAGGGTVCRAPPPPPHPPGLQGVTRTWGWVWDIDCGRRIVLTAGGRTNITQITRVSQVYHSTISKQASTSMAAMVKSGEYNL